MTQVGGNVELLASIGLEANFYGHPYVKANGDGTFRQIQAKGEDKSNDLFALIDTVVKSSLTDSQKELVYFSLLSFRQIYHGKLKGFWVRFSKRRKRVLNARIDSLDEALRQLAVEREIRATTAITQRMEALRRLNLHRPFRFVHSSSDLENQVKYLHGELLKEYEVTTDTVVEILRGAHFVIPDDGKLVKEMQKRFKGSIRGISSHYRGEKADQFRVSGRFFRELLYGTTKQPRGQPLTEKEKKWTWFQLENTPARFGYFIRHMIDYLKYKITGRNVGPYGLSSYTEANPLVLKKKPPGSPVA